MNHPHILTVSDVGIADGVHYIAAELVTGNTLSHVEEREPLSLGFADAIITSLGNLEDFLVLPTSAILKYPSGSDPLTVSAELHVRYVLQGNIQKIGSRWRVTLQLYDAVTRQTVLVLNRINTILY